MITIVTILTITPTAIMTTTITTIIKNHTSSDSNSRGCERQYRECRYSCCIDIQEAKETSWDVSVFLGR
jgi:hypothetical protein